MNINYPMSGRSGSALSVFVPGTEAVVTNRFRSCGISNTDPNQRYWSRFFGVQFNRFLLQFTNPPDPQQYIAYCLNYNRRGPEPTEEFISGDPYALLNELTEQQVNQTLWLLMNGYPYTSAQQLFLEAGVDPFTPPALNDLDAFTATQLAIWVIETGQANYSIQNCETAVMHVKSARIGAAAQYLVSQAQVFGNHPPVEPVVSLNQLGDTSFEQNGVYYVGPFEVTSSTDQPITITISEDFSAYIVNQNLEPQTMFNSGDTFYAAFPAVQPGLSLCAVITASIIGTSVTPYVLAPINGDPALQDLGAVTIIPEALLAESAIQACVNIQPQPCPPICIPCWELHCRPCDSCCLPICPRDNY